MNSFSSFHVAILGCNQRQRKQSKDKPTSEFKQRERDRARDREKPVTLCWHDSYKHASVWACLSQSWLKWRQQFGRPKCRWIEEEIKERTALGTKAYYANLNFFKSRLVTKQSKLKLYRTAVRPIVTYASETWVLKETIIQKLLVFERKIVRRIFGPTKETKYGESKPMKN